MKNSLAVTVTAPNEDLLQQIEAAKTQFGADYDEARADALSVGLDEDEAEELASDWVDVKACYSVLNITLPDI